MCLPLVGTLISTALSIGQMSAQNDKEYAAKEAQNRHYTQNRKNAVAAANDKYRSIGNKADQEREKSSQEIFTKRVEMLKKSATALTSAGEGGVTGLSVAALSQDYIAMEARAESNILTNHQYTLGGLYDEADASYHDASSRINSVQPGSPIPVYDAYTGGLGGDGGQYRNTA